MLFGLFLLPLAIGDPGHGHHIAPVRVDNRRVDIRVDNRVDNRRVDTWGVPRYSFPPHPLPLRPVRPVLPLRGLFSLVDKSRRRSQNVGHSRLVKGRGQASQNSLQPLTPSLPSYSTARLHDYIRKQEGTEIFDGRKDHVNRLVMHYVEAPEIIATENYGETIDERTPNVDIVAENNENENTIPDTVVGFIGAKEPQKYTL